MKTSISSKVNTPKNSSFFQQSAHSKDAAPSSKKELNQATSSSNYAFHFSQIPIQPKLKINAPNDQYEQEADRVAAQVMSKSKNAQPSIQRMPNIKEEEQASIQTQSTTNKSNIASDDLSQQIQNTRGKGHAMASPIRSFMEDRFEKDFSNIRIHANEQAAQMSQSINAKAFTVGNDIYFNRGAYQANSFEGKNLLAHELVHTIQQSNTPAQNIQRVVEFRPPGRGEASAFDRVQEFVDRLNSISLGVSYNLAEDGRTLQYSILIPRAMNHFDFKVTEFIDLEQTIPLRLVNSQGRVNGHPVVFDTFTRGYVDLDDMLASDDLAFQSLFIHFMEERAVTNRYAQRIGSPSLNQAAFDRGHEAGHQAQAEHWRDVMGDASIQFHRNETRPNGTVNLIFRSTDHNYRIFITIRRAARTPTNNPRTTTGATTRIRFNSQWFTVEEFLNQGIVPGSNNIFDRPLGSSLRRQPSFGLDVPQLQLDPTFQLQRQRIQLLQQNITNPNPSSTPSSPTPNLNFNPSLLNPQPAINPAAFQFNSPSSTPSASQIDWGSINQELHFRGVMMDDRLASSIVSVWNDNYNFFRNLGLPHDLSLTATNATISTAVGNGLNRDHPTIFEQSDRESDISTTIVPVIPIINFLTGSKFGRF